MDVGSEEGPCHLPGAPGQRGLGFVKKQLDTRRTKDVRKYEVTVFRDVENGSGKPGRGFTSIR